MTALATATDPVTVANRLRPTLLKLNRHLRREIHSLGVTGGQASLLFAIQRRRGIGVRELAALERMSAPGMSKYVGRLEAAGLVAREPSGDDRRRVCLGQAVSQTGTWIDKIAQAWLVLALTHSAVAVGILAACQFVPFSVLGLVAGVVVDRLDAWRTVVWTQAIRMVLAGTLAGIVVAGVAQVWMVYVLALLTGIVLVL